MTYALQHLSQDDIRRISELALAMSEDGEKAGKISDLDMDAIFTQSPEDLALEEAVFEFSREKKLELIALMYFGRGDASDEAHDLGIARLRAIFERTADEEIVRKITEKSPTLASYLDVALLKIGV